MCAVGALIPDALYDPRMDNTDEGHTTSIGCIIGEFPTLAEHFKDVADTMLEDIQHVHDSMPVWEWQAGCKDVAETYNLTMPHISWKKCTDKDPALLGGEL
jgi:hypothetical protein